jgi:hypothetical protein
MTINKAIVGAVLAALTVVATEGRDLLPTWLLVLVSALITGGTVWAVPNRPARWERVAGNRRTDVGQSAGYVLLLVLAVVGVVYIVVDLAR